MKAKKVFTMYGKHSNTVTYEYKGIQYDVEYATDWTYCVTPASVQHKDAQEKIDRMIEQADRHETSGNTECFDIDDVFNLMGWN